MAAKILDGRQLAEQVKREVAEKAAGFAAAGNRPKLVAVQVGRHPASELYTRMQQRSCDQVGINYELVTLPADLSKQNLVEKIQQLNEDDSVTALILQMPLPEHIDAREIQTVVSPSKDAESVHPANMGKLFFDDYVIAPCTAMAALSLLCAATDDLAGREIVVVGHSEIFGKPLAAMLLASRSASPTVTVCHVATKDLKSHTRRAEVLIVAAGVAQRRWLEYQQARKAGQGPPLPDLSPLVTAEYLRDGAIVIDVAINRIPKALDNAGEPVVGSDGRAEMVTVGDVDFDAAVEKVSAITPVPGGVGPATVAMLLKNVITCAELAGKAK